MKKTLLLQCCLWLALGAVAQKDSAVIHRVDSIRLVSADHMVADTFVSRVTIMTEKSVREKILGDIQRNLDNKNKVLDSTIYKLDGRVGKLDSMIKSTGNPRERIDKLVERVQVLEEKQKAIEQNELNIYEANYQSAVINLVSMDREIKPLVLFHASRDFFNTLTQTCDPMAYPAFSKGFAKYHHYVDDIKGESATQKTIAEVIGATGASMASIPLVGAYSQLLFNSMSEYVNSIGHSKREMKDEAEKMFSVTVSLSQFVSDKNLIENEWDGITESLEEMQVDYDTLLNQNLRMMEIDRAELKAGFTHQTDANKRYLYLTLLREKAAAYVRNIKATDPKDWKEIIYYQLIDVQSQKVRYGDITYRIKRHIGKYTGLANKYKNNKEIGVQVVKLDDKLNQLKSTFDEAFEPTQYLHAANQMYKVN